MLDEVVKRKEEKLKKILKKAKRILIAYSGGVDSTFLLKSAVDCLGAENVGAFIETADLYPDSEINFAKKFADSLGVKVFVFSSKKLQEKRFLENSRNRCFYCKKDLFSKMAQFAKENDFNAIADGSNFDDISDYRPGNKAKLLYGVISPLQMAGFNKKDIRYLSKKMGLPTWNKPQMACLASRIPYGEIITKKRLKRILLAENYLRKLGFDIVRVRDYENLCRIEVSPLDLKKILDKRQQIIKNFKKFGYIFVTVDLEGYVSGSMNKVIS